MASSRITGTNEQISTYDSAGGKNYTACATWEAATDTNHVADAETDVLECYKGAHVDYPGSMIGSTNNSTYFRIIRPATGEGHSGIPLTDGSVVAFLSTATGSMIYTTEGYNSYQDLVLDKYVNTSSANQVVSSQTNGGISVIGCLIKRMLNDGAGYGHGFRCDVDASFVNCFAHDIDRVSYYAVAGTIATYNCGRVTDAYSWYILSGATVNAKNCVMDGSVQVEGGGTLNQTTNTTSTPSYVDSANDDFHLKSDDTVAINNGTDLSGAAPHNESVFPFDDDIDGVTITGTWDIGFDEFVAAGAPPFVPKITISQLMNNTFNPVLFFATLLSGKLIENPKLNRRSFLNIFKW